MNELVPVFLAICKQYGLPGVIVVYLAIKELNMLKKKRSGTFVSYGALSNDIRQIKREMEEHKEEDRKMMNEQNVLKAQQIELGRRLEDNVHRFREEVQDMKTDIREVRAGVSDIKDILLQGKK